MSQPDNLLTAIGNGDAQRTQVLLASGKNPNGRDPNRVPLIHLAAETGNTRTLQLLLAAGAKPDQPDDRGATALMVAASHSNIACLSVLVEAGADPNAVHVFDGGTPLICAIYATHDSPQLIAELIRLGADVNLPSFHEETPLMHAINTQHNRTQMHIEPFDNAAFEELLKAGAHVHAATDQANTALHATAATGQRVFARRLLSLCANLEVRNKAGMTPLLSAAAQGQTQMIRFLIRSYEADADAVDNQGLGVEEHFTSWLQNTERSQRQDEELLATVPF